VAKRSKQKRKLQKALPKEVVAGNSASRLSPLDWKLGLGALIIALATFWIYWPALHGDWLWDDDQLITQNPLIHDPDGWWKIWLQPLSLVDYFPIKVSVEWIEWHLWGSDTLGYHITSVILHGVNALLVWRLLHKLGLRLAWLGGLIFAIHPLQVESVAWIAELKNTLSLFPFLLAMCAWIDFDGHGRRKDYLLALGFFTVAMLCKTSMVMFPLVILLHGWWRRGRLAWNDLRASLPFFAVSLVLGMVTVWFTHHHSAVDKSAPAGGLLPGLALTGLTVAFYVSKFVLPIRLLPIYPSWNIDPPSLVQFLPWLVAIALIFYLWSKRRSWGRSALFGMGFFIINLLPVLGFILAKYKVMIWSMDHMMYLPILGLIGLMVAAMEQIGNHLAGGIRTWGAILIAATMGLFAILSHTYATKFVNEITLWTYALQGNPQGWFIHNQLGAALFKVGQLSEAKAQYQIALRIEPAYADAQNNLGTVLAQEGDLNNAIDQFKKALQNKPGSASAHCNFGDALLQSNRPSEAMAQYQAALQIDPGFAEAHNGLGNVLRKQGELGPAIAQFQQAVQNEPDKAEIRYNFGNTLLQAGRVADAIEQYQAALRINPNFAEVHNTLGTVFSRQGNLSSAIEQFQSALRITPHDAEVHYNLGNALFNERQITEAMAQYQEAVRLKPDFVGAHNGLACAWAASGHFAEAAAEFKLALQLDPNNSEARKNLQRLEQLEKGEPIHP
jgi:tetratricopeptide (TPR) repeat protein